MHRRPCAKNALICRVPRVCVDQPAAAYGACGRLGSSPAQLAMVTVLQFTENPTDRRAEDAVGPGADDRMGGRSGLASCRHQPQYERSEDQLHGQLHLPARHDDDVRP